VELHAALVKLHKALLDSERQVYEKNIGRIQSPNHFFQLLTSDPFFAWLRPISQLIVAIDETLDAKELTHTDVDAVMAQSVFPAGSCNQWRRIWRALCCRLAARSARRADPRAGRQADRQPPPRGVS
jgi:hypothetical protein